MGDILYCGDAYFTPTFRGQVTFADMVLDLIQKNQKIYQEMSGVQISCLVRIEVLNGEKPNAFYGIEIYFSVVEIFYFQFSRVYMEMPGVFQL